MPQWAIFLNVTSYLNYLEVISRQVFLQPLSLVIHICFLYSYKSSAPNLVGIIEKCLNSSANMEIFLPCVNVPGSWHPVSYNPVEAKVQCLNTLLQFTKITELIFQLQSFL